MKKINARISDLLKSSKYADQKRLTNKIEYFEKAKKIIQILAKGRNVDPCALYVEISGCDSIYVSIPEGRIRIANHLAANYSNDIVRNIIIQKQA